MSYLHSKIDAIDDADFQYLVDELYQCVAWRRSDSLLPTLWYLLNAISAQDPKALTAAHLPTDGVLTTKVNKLPNGAVYELCREIANLKRTHIESYDGKTVLSLLKNTAPKPDRPQKHGRNALRHDALIRVIEQRRANGDL